MEKIRSGSLYDIAEVLRDLYSRGVGRELSFGEKEMLERAKERLVNEISAAKSKEKSDIVSEIDSVLLSH
jgi:CarD family transcriptional regulator